MGDVPNVLRYWLATDAGAHVAACSRRCMAALVASTPVEAALGPEPARDEDGIPTPTPAGPALDTDLDRPLAALWPFGACAHCAWCGRLASSPRGGCRLHEKSCPVFAWEFTTAGVAALSEVRRRTGTQFFTPRALAAFTEVARLLDQAGRYPDLPGLVDGVMDRRVDWMP